MKSFLLLILIAQFTFAQGESRSLEDKIYGTIDLFVSHPNIESLKKLEAAEKKIHPKTKPELLALVILKCNKAYYENQFGFTTKAISSYEKAWQLFQNHQLKNYDITEYCLKPLGNLYTIVRDYDNAENTIKQYFFIANAENNQPQKMAAVLNLSNVYQSSGKNDQAIFLLEKTLKTEKLSEDQKGILFNNLGANYMIDSNFGQAKKHLAASIDLLKNNQAEIHTVSNANRNLALIYNREHHFKIADFHFETAKKLFFKTKNQEARKIARLHYDEALLLFEQEKWGETTAAIKHIFKILIPNYSFQKKLLPNQNSLYAETVLIDALDLQAQVFSQQNQPKKALECYLLSFHAEELLQSLLVYENSKIITQIRNRNRTEKCIAIYDALYQKEKEMHYIETAFQLQESTKTSVLKESISAKKNISKEEKEIVEMLQNWSNIILKEQQKGDLADISKINEAIKKQNELMLLLKSEHSKTKDFIPESINTFNLFKKLEHDKATMISYFYGVNDIYFFTLSQGEITLQTIKITEELNNAMYRFLRYFSDANAIVNDAKGYNLTGNKVYEILRLEKNSKKGNLLIIPDGILNFLPFEALITQKSATANFTKMHYLLDACKIAYNNSADFYLKAKSFQNTKENVLGVFPVFENTPQELIFSKVELDNLKEQFDGIYLEKEKATFGNFKTHAGHFSILHLSTHAASGDIFIPASIQFYDREILYSELYHLNINADLVVLSACETGLGKLYKAEGAMSVARGFQSAGAQNLLFSLWKVNDYSTSVFMNYFYQNVKNDHSYFESNHLAKLDYLHDAAIPNAKKSPYYWSAMVYYGTLEPKLEIPYFTYISLAILVSLVLFLLFKKTQNGRSTKNPKRK
jgi:CHAT domain-containing protein/tetratricopeptide (TPR) repeat protein